MTNEPVPDEKRMRLRYAGTCRLCARVLPAGVEAIYERGTKTVRCVSCACQDSMGDGASLGTGAAGVSARREYERRKQAREGRVRTRFPKLGGLILALSDEPQSTRAWERGAIGEERLAQRLEDLPHAYRVLHDRRIPRSRANIDHIVIGPTGVWVIDAKRYVGKRPELRVEGGIIRPRVDSLRIGGRNGDKLVAGVRSQVECVVAAVGDPAVPVQGVLCFLDGDWPMFGASFTVDDVRVLWPRLLITRIAEADHTATDVNQVAARVARVFGSA